MGQMDRTPVLQRCGLGLLAAVCLVLGGCGPRGALTIYPEAAAVGALEPVYVATTRLRDGGPNVWAAGRADLVDFARFEVSVPPQRAQGTVTFPSTLPPDPQTDFLTVSARNIAGEQAFVRKINADLAMLPRDAQEVIVFTHGFNTNFSEGLYRQAQMTHDFNSKGVSVHYSWPSAATVQGYGFDRESAIFARDGLRETLNAVARTSARRIIVAAHSMGAMVMMEALRSMAEERDDAFFAKLQGVVLMAPDLDIDVFRGQMRPLADRGVSFYVFFSSRDRALQVSSLIRGQDARLGSIRDLTAVSGFDITFIDTTNTSEGGDALGHFAVATSPAMIAFIQGLGRIGGDVIADAQIDPNLFETTVNVVQGVTDVVLEPLVP